MNQWEEDNALGGTDILYTEDYVHASLGLPIQPDGTAQPWTSTPTSRFIARLVDLLIDERCLQPEDFARLVERAHIRHHRR